MDHGPVSVPVQHGPMGIALGLVEAEPIPDIGERIQIAGVLLVDVPDAHALLSAATNHQADGRWPPVRQTDIRVCEDAHGFSLLLASKEVDRAARTPLEALEDRAKPPSLPAVPRPPHAEPDIRVLWVEGAPVAGGALDLGGGAVSIREHRVNVGSRPPVHDITDDDPVPFGLPAHDLRKRLSHQVRR